MVINTTHVAFSHFADQNFAGLCSYSFFVAFLNILVEFWWGFLSMNWFAGIVFQVSKTSDFFYRFMVLILSPDSGPKMMTMQYVGTRNEAHYLGSFWGPHRCTSGDLVC
jgi:hypothetical protein